METNETKQVNENEKQYKVVIKPSVARKLLKMGNEIKDIKPNNMNHEASVFVFELSEKFKADIREILKK